MLAATPVGIAVDTDFGDGGIAVTDVTGLGSNYYTESVNAAAVTPEGKIVLAGIGRAQAAAVRYDVDGRLDASFGAGGVAVFPVDSASAVTAASLLPDGKLLLAGYSEHFTGTSARVHDAFLLRLNPDGTPDPTFGPVGNGRVDLPGALFFGMVLSDDGKILTGGRLSGGGTFGDGWEGYGAMWRFNPDGTFDDAFGAGGTVTRDQRLYEQLIRPDVIMPDGSILAVSPAGVERFFGDGSTAGMFGVSDRYAYISVKRIVRQPADGKVLVLQREAENDLDSSARVYRLNPDGTFDATFGNGGSVLLDWAGGRGEPWDLVVEPDGRIVVGAWTYVAEATSYDFALARLLSDGAPDPSFGPGGMLVHALDPNPNDSYAGYSDRLTRLALTPDGGLVAAGISSILPRGVPGATSDDNFVAVKYALDPPLVADLRQLAPADEGATIAVSAEGSSYAAGQIVRYEWDANYDGSRFTADAEGVTATLPAGDDNPPRRVMLRVTTSDGLVAMAGPVPLQLRNLPPVVGPLKGPDLVAVGVGATVVTGSATDPGGDRFTVHIDYGDGTGADSAIGPGGAFAGGPHAYGARGTYTVTATVTDDDGAPTTVQKEVRVVDVTGTVFKDRSDDGSRDTEDAPLAGVTVYADVNGDGAPGAGEPAAVTGTSGDYFFDALPPGTYQFRVVPPAGLREDTPPSQSTPVTIGAGSGGVRNFALTDRSRITGAIFNDANANGVRDVGEATLGLAAEVYIDGNDDGSFNVGEIQAKAEPGAGYVFRNLDPGTYKVRFLRDVPGGRPTSYVQTAPAGPGGHEGDSVTVGPAQIAGGNDFGAYAPPQNQVITGAIFDDRNRSGARDTGEPLLSNRLAYIDADGDGQLDPDERRSPLTSTSEYIFPVLPGTYSVRVAVPQGWVQSLPAGGAAQVVTVVAGQPARGRDFGLHREAVPVVVDRHLVYLRSAFDASNNDADDVSAFAADKRPLFSGQAASFDNVSSYSRGINGVAVDITGLPDPPNLPQSDWAKIFAFKVGDFATDPAGWAAAPAPVAVGVHTGIGTDSFDRVTVTFADNAIRNQWLQVTVLATTYTGLAAPEVFYFGSLVGETGDATSPFRVTAADLGAIKKALNSDATVSNRYDFNRDGKVNALDLGLAKANLNRRLTPLSPPIAAAAALVNTASGATALLKGEGDPTVIVR